MTNAVTKKQDDLSSKEVLNSKGNALNILAQRLNVGPETLKKTLMATVFKNCVNDSDFIACVIVANTYQLNPITKEIYAYPAKGGGVVPIVSTDGWTRIMVSHPEYLTHSFQYSEKDTTLDDAKTCPEWMEITIKKKNGEQVVIREYLDEVYQKPFVKDNRTINGPWQTHTKRMLRHKTKIQGAREAFGFGGIYDEDEAARIIEAQDVEFTATSNKTNVKMPEAVEQEHAGFPASEYISEEQINKFNQIVESVGMDEAAVAAELSFNFEVADRSQITKEDYQKICSHFEFKRKKK